MGEDQNRIILPIRRNLPVAQIESCFISSDLKYNGTYLFKMKGTFFRDFNKLMEDVEIPQLKASYIVHYNEQFPKEGRCQKFRPSLLDAKTKKKIAEEVFGDKLLHQYCLLHLNHEKEIEKLVQFDLEERELIKNEVIYKARIKKVKNEFYRFVHEFCNVPLH